MISCRNRPNNLYNNHGANPDFFIYLSDGGFQNFPDHDRLDIVNILCLCSKFESEARFCSSK